MDENWSLDAAHVELRFLSQSWHGMRVRVSIDDVWVGALIDRQPRSFAVAPGTHSIKVECDRHVTPPVEATVSPRGRAVLECGLGTDGRPAPRLPDWGVLTTVLLAGVALLMDYWRVSFTMFGLMGLANYIVERRVRRRSLFLRPPIDPEISKSEKRAKLRRPQWTLRQAMLGVAIAAILSAACSCDRREILKTRAMQTTSRRLPMPPAAAPRVMKLLPNFSPTTGAGD